MNKHFLFRRDYSPEVINFSDLASNPMIQFDVWFKLALEKEKNEPNAMAFASVDKYNQPSVRYILLKSYDSTGFIFFTNYESRKSKEISNNPKVAIVFYWPIIQKQIRAEGEIKMLSEVESDEYFNLRPTGSKIGAWASPQSKPIPNREYLEKLKNEYEEKYKHFRIPRPKHWGGYKLEPNLIEFWQGQPDRLHDRFEYRLKDNVWKKERLAP